MASAHSREVDMREWTFGAPCCQRAALLRHLPNLRHDRLGDDVWGLREAVDEELGLRRVGAGHEELRGHHSRRQVVYADAVVVRELELCLEALGELPKGALGGAVRGETRRRVAIRTCAIHVEHVATRLLPPHRLDRCLDVVGVRRRVMCMGCGLFV